MMNTNWPVMMMVVAEHNCLHEEQILNQSMKIERLDAELVYKKERLDELKEDNRRMERKIDKLSEDVTDFIGASDTKDNELNNRLIKIETKQQVQDEMTKKNRDDFKLWLAIITVVFGAITIYNNFLR